MISPATSQKNSSSDIYHDIYDFSLFPVSLGDIINWGVKSALRAAAVGRNKVHVHLICDPKKSGFNPLQGSDYLADLLIVEAIPAFYSHPYFCGLSVHRSREDFRETFAKIGIGDPLAQNLYAENESYFKDRSNYDRLGDYFTKCCASHEDINDYFEKNGTLPQVGFLEDCLVDWHALQSRLPKETFWVTVQFRLRKLDGGLPVSEEGLLRDASFLTWYNFIREARRFPSVRFVVIGRIQEKPVELLRLPNVMTLRTLGMNLGHEITALLNSDLFMGTSSGFASAAQVSKVPYDIFNCNAAACKNFCIPFGTDRLRNAVEGQKLHYGPETVELLMQTLTRHMENAPRKVSLPGKVEVNRTPSTHRFFITDDQSAIELESIFSPRFMAIVLAAERGEHVAAQTDLENLSKSFPDLVSRWPEFKWLSEILKKLTQSKAAGEEELSLEERNRLLKQVSAFCHPDRLIRRNGRYFDNLPGFEGLIRDGWCEQTTKLVFAPSDKGDLVIIQVLGLSSSEPTRLSVTINRQKAMDFVLLNEYAVLELPIAEPCIPTFICIESDRAFTVRAKDDKKYSFQIENAGLASERAPMPGFYAGDKRESREKIISGLYSNGAVSSLGRVRIDNPFPDDVEIMISLIARIPRMHRKGQRFSIQINEGEVHEAVISGKHLEVHVPCPGHPRHIAIVLRFWDEKGSPLAAEENRAFIKTIKVLPATVKKAVIKSGFRSALSYLLGRLKSD